MPYKDPKDKKAQSVRYYRANRERILAYNTIYRKTPEGRAAHQRGKQRWTNTPRGDYAQHKARAKTRCIAFNLTFDEWWSYWEPYWTTLHSTLHMCRTGDKGPYAVGNVRIDTIQANRAEQQLVREAATGRFIA